MIVKSKNVILALFYVLVISWNQVSAQEIWSLEKCIKYAIENSLTIQNSEILLSGTEIDVTQTKHLQYPNLSGSTNVGWNFGRTIDPTNNQFVNETFFNNGFSLNSGVTLYNGGKLNNNKKLAINNNRASKLDLEQTKRDLSLNIATLYLNILFANENLANAKNQLTQTLDQKKLIVKQIEVGNRPENDVLDLEAQIATNEQTIVESENNLIINLLNLKQLLRLDPDYDLQIMAPSALTFDLDPELVTFNEVYESALNNQSSIAASELGLKSAYISEKIAKADLIPRIGAGISSSTNYSNKGFSIDGYDTVIGYQNILFNGQQAEIGIEQQVPNIINKPYGNQFSDNISYAVGISMSIPIYNNNIGRAGIQRAKLNTSRANLNFIQVKETLKITIGQALSDARAAKSKYFATTKTLQAQSNVYNNALKRFESGGLNSFELTRLKTLFESGVVNNLVAKYDYFFKIKVLDFYLGRNLNF